MARAGAEAYEKVDRGEKKVVGVNCFEMEETPYEFEPVRPDPKTWELAMASLDKVRSTRDASRADRAKADLVKALEGGENTMPATIEAVRAGVTVGEVGAIYREFFGCWNVPALPGLG